MSAEPCPAETFLEVLDLHHRQLTEQKCILQRWKKLIDKSPKVRELYDTWLPWVYFPAALAGELSVKTTRCLHTMWNVSVKVVDVQEFSLPTRGFEAKSATLAIK